MTLSVPGPAGRVDICYTGHLLGQVESLPRLATAIKAQRKPGSVPWLIDTGNVMADEPQRDRVVGDVYSHLGYAALALGPNDCRRGEDRLAALVSGRGFVLLASDLSCPVPFVTPFLSSRCSGFNVALLAFSGCEWNGDEALAPAVVLERYLVELQTHHDFVVLISHLGFEADRRLAQAFDGVDAIISGVASEAFNTPLTVSGTILAPAARGSVVGLLSLERPTEWVVQALPG